METFTHIDVVQDNVPFDRGVVDENYIQLKFSFHKFIGCRSSPESPIRWDSQIHEGGTDIWVEFPKIKRVASSYRSVCVTSFQDFLATTNVPADKHALVIQKLFEAVDAAQSPDLPINLVISNVSILQRVRLDALRLENEDQCAICWLAYAEEEHEVVQLPCSHYFHEHCIVRWFHINSICPMCRSPLPNQP